MGEDVGVLVREARVLMRMAQARLAELEAAGVEWGDEVEMVEDLVGWLEAWVEDMGQQEEQ